MKIERDLLGNKPLRDCLRQCVSLGGDLRSARLRDWAMKELMGYQEGDEVASYRMVTGMLLGDAQRFHQRISGMAIPWTALPDGIREHVVDTITLPKTVQQIADLFGCRARRCTATSTAPLLDVPHRSATPRQ